MQLTDNNYDFSKQRKQVVFADRNEAVLGFKPNSENEAIVAVGRKVQCKHDRVTSHDKKVMPYEDYLVYRYKRNYKKRY